jgi:hypothetical protein
MSLFYAGTARSDSYTEAEPPLSISWHPRAAPAPDSREQEEQTVPM